MKKLFFLLTILLIVNVSFSQQKPKSEPTEMSIPYDVAQKMLLDLNEYDRLKELSKLDKEEIKIAVMTYIDNITKQLSDKSA